MGTNNERSSRTPMNRLISLLLVFVIVCSFVPVETFAVQPETLTLAQLRDADIDMFSTIFIGNAQTRMIGGNMVTPRGYRDV